MQGTRIRLLFSWAVPVALSLASVPASGAQQGKAASAGGDQLLLNVCVSSKKSGTQYVVTAPTGFWATK